MKYTKAQMEAINYINGNLQIIACAGSGKTETISARIANIVLSGVPKEQILAFTFTEKAANEMKLRIRGQLEQFMPDNPELGGMYIGTIHSFCLRYLKEIIPDYRNYDIIDTGKQLLFLSRHFMDLGLNRLRRKKENPLMPIVPFAKTVDIIKQNQINEATIQEDNPAFHGSYIMYHELMKEHKFFDFSTIIEKLVTTIEDDHAQRALIQNRIKYVVVDEYQDINPIQEKLINLIAGKNGNLCVVGDDDQAIFEFQGANVENIVTFAKRYNNVKKIDLLTNFRSTNTIIEAARNVILYNRGNRLEKMMEHGKEYRKGEKGDVYLVEFACRQEEVEFIAAKILELRGYKYLESINEETGEELYRGLDWCDFAILVRNNATAGDFIETFQAKNIPFTARGTAGLFERDEVRFLQMIFNNICNMNIRYSETSVDCSMNALRGFYESRMDKGRWGRIEQTISDIRSEIGEGKRFYPQSIYHQILNSMGMEEGLFDEGKLYDFGRFSQLILDFETVNEWVNINRLKSFVYFLNGYAESRTDVGGLDDPTKLNTVTIQSVHKAKGLEYPVVFIPDLAKGRFPSRNRNKVPDVYLDNIDLKRFTSGELGERRLFYVGITRSEKFLFMTMAHDIGHRMQYNNSPYFDEYTSDLLVTRDTPDPTNRQIVEPTPKTILEIIPTTFSDLQYFLKCPYDYLLRVLMGFSPTIDLSFGYGLQIHNLLNRIHSENEGITPDSEQVEHLTESEFFLRYTRGQIFENMKNKAKKILKTYVDSFHSDFALKLETEKPFEFVLDDALISGQIDLITRINPGTDEIHDVNLIDFKTEKKEGRKERDPLNRLQLRLYAIAAGRALGLNPLISNIHYLTDNVRFEVDVSEQKLNEARTIINDTVQGIKRRSFPKKPGKQCEECDFCSICPKR